MMSSTGLLSVLFRAMSVREMEISVTWEGIFGISVTLIQNDQCISLAPPTLHRSPSRKDVCSRRVCAIESDRASKLEFSDRPSRSQWLNSIWDTIHGIFVQ